MGWKDVRMSGGEAQVLVIVGGLVSVGRVVLEEST